MAGDRWIFSQDQLVNTPSRKCGIDQEKEIYYRQQAANFIQDMGQRLQVTQLCINTSIVYMHRFYMFHSYTKFNRNRIAAACLFIAAKVEEQPRKLEHLIKVAHTILNKDQGPLDTSSEAYLEQAQELVVNENILLQSLGFEITVDHPHSHIVRACTLVKASKDLGQTSYFLATNSLHLTTMSLEYKPTVVACVCIHLACKWAMFEIPKSNEGKEWFTYIDSSITAEFLEDLTQSFLAILDKCPSKFKKKLMSSRQKDDEIANAFAHLPAGSGKGNFNIFTGKPERSSKSREAKAHASASQSSPKASTSQQVKSESGQAKVPTAAHQVKAEPGQAKVSTAAHQVKAEPGQAKVPTAAHQVKAEPGQAKVSTAAHQVKAEPGQAKVPTAAHQVKAEPGQAKAPVTSHPIKAEPVQVKAEAPASKPAAQSAISGSLSEGALRRVRTEGSLSTMTPKEYFEKKERQRIEKDRQLMIIERGGGSQKDHGGARKDPTSDQDRLKPPASTGKSEQHESFAKSQTGAKSYTEHTNIFDQMQSEKTLSDIESVSTHERHSLERSKVEQSYKDKFHESGEKPRAPNEGSKRLSLPGDLTRRPRKPEEASTRPSHPGDSDVSRAPHPEESSKRSSNSGSTKKPPSGMESRPRSSADGSRSQAVSDSDKKPLTQPWEGSRSQPPEEHGKRPPGAGESASKRPLQPPPSDGSKRLSLPAHPTVEGGKKPAQTTDNARRPPTMADSAKRPTQADDTKRQSRPDEAGKQAPRPREGSRRPYDASDGGKLRGYESGESGKRSSQPSDVTRRPHPSESDKRTHPGEVERRQQAEGGKKLDMGEGSKRLPSQPPPPAKERRPGSGSESGRSSEHRHRGHGGERAHGDHRSQLPHGMREGEGRPPRQEPRAGKDELWSERKASHESRPEKYRERPRDANGRPAAGSGMFSSQESRSTADKAHHRYPGDGKKMRSPPEYTAKHTSPRGGPGSSSSRHLKDDSSGGNSSGRSLKDDSFSESPGMFSPPKPPKADPKPVFEEMEEGELEPGEIPSPQSDASSLDSPSSPPSVVERTRRLSQSSQDTIQADQKLRAEALVKLQRIRESDSGSENGAPFPPSPTKKHCETSSRSNLDTPTNVPPAASTLFPPSPTKKRCETSSRSNLDMPTNVPLASSQSEPCIPSLKIKLGPKPSGSNATSERKIGTPKSDTKASTPKNEPPMPSMDKKEFKLKIKTPQPPQQELKDRVSTPPSHDRKDLKLKLKLPTRPNEPLPTAGTSGGGSKGHRDRHGNSSEKSSPTPLKLVINKDKVSGHYSSSGHNGSGGGSSKHKAITGLALTPASQQQMSEKSTAVLASQSRKRPHSPGDVSGSGGGASSRPHNAKVPRNTSSSNMPRNASSSNLQGDLLAQQISQLDQIISQMERPNVQSQHMNSPLAAPPPLPPNDLPPCPPLPPPH